MLLGFFRRTSVCALAAVMALSLPRAADAGGRHAAMILDANSGAILYDQAGDEPRHPASLTKMMTIYMAFELIEMGRLSYTTPIKVTAEAAAAAPSKLDLEPGETILLIDAIKALVTKSANDMAIAIAQHIGGSEANFARLMTEKARQLGMRNTVFRNASGLPNDQQVTTARDMITLGLHLQDDFPKHYPLFGLRSFTYHGGSYRNHNTLLLSYRGTDGIKTGYTRMSGFNLVANVRRDGKHLVGAIFGGDSAAARNAHLRSLFDRVLARASTNVTRKAPASPLVVAQRDERKSKPQRTARAETSEPEAPPAPKRATRPAKAEPTPEPARAPKAQTATAAQPTARQAPAAPTEPSDAVSPAASAAAAALAKLPPDTAAHATADAASPAEPASTASDAPAAVAEAPNGLNISVAKVRRVMVAPRVNTKPGDNGSQPADAATSDDNTDEAAPSVEPRRSGTFTTAATTGRLDLARAAPSADRAPAASAAPALQETVLAKSTGPSSREPIAAAPGANEPRAAEAGPARAPSTFANQMAALAANVVPAERARNRDVTAAATEPPLPAQQPPAAAAQPMTQAVNPGGGVAAAPATSAAPHAGRAPSTLSAQADAIAALARDEAPAPRQQVAAVEPPTYRLRGPQGLQPAATPPPAARTAPTPTPLTLGNGQFQIQIGAFSTPTEAQRRLSVVHAAAATLLNGHEPLTIPVAKSNRTLYRARFASFDANSAAAACLELRRQQIDCFVMKAE